jgi:hypothetical protein
MGVRMRRRSCVGCSDCAGCAKRGMRGVRGFGEPPAIVKIGAPGARDEVRAYADRIHSAWEDFIANDVDPFVAKRSGKSDSEALIGDVVDDVTLLGGMSTADRDAVLKIHEDRSSFESYRESISGFSITGPSPSEAWQVLIDFEATYKADRKRLKSRGWTLQTSTPGALEAPGGISQEGLPPILVGVVAIAGVAAVAYLAHEVYLFTGPISRGRKAKA